MSEKPIVPLPGQKSFLPQRPTTAMNPTHWEDGDFAVRAPAVYQLLAHAVKEGHFRAGATLSFFCEMGKLKASIYDRESQMVWFCAISGEGDWVDAVDVALQSGSGEWREKKHTGK